MSVVTTNNEAIQKYLDLFNDNKQSLFEAESFDNEIREKAFKEFSELGFPQKKSEKYKYTNIQSLLEYDFKTNFSPDTFQVNLHDVFKCDIPELNTYTVLLLNGYYYTRNNPNRSLPEGVIITSLKEAYKAHPELVKKHFNKYASQYQEGLVAFNTMLSQDGIFIYIPKNIVVDEPIQVINVSLSERDLLINHRNLIVVDDNAKVNVVICDHTLCFKKYFTNSVTEIFIGDNATFEYNKVQNENNDSIQLSHTYVNQEANSRGDFNTICLHGGVIRNNLDIKLVGEGAENGAHGLYLTDKNQHIDFYTNIEHLKPHCTSTQLFKGILDDEATGAFNGKIHVYPDAQKTMAYQTNNNILLTDTSKMSSKPTLEIYADDVKCSHGATAGQLNENAMFYLQTRGINKREARLLMLYAFADEIISKISIEALQFRMRHLIDQRLRGELARCHNCQAVCG